MSNTDIGMRSFRGYFHHRQKHNIQENDDQLPHRRRRRRDFWRSCFKHTTPSQVKEQPNRHHSFRRWKNKKTLENSQIQIRDLAKAEDVESFESVCISPLYKQYGLDSYDAMVSSTPAKKYATKKFSLVSSTSTMTKLNDNDEPENIGDSDNEDSGNDEGSAFLAKRNDLRLFRQQIQQDRLGIYDNDTFSSSRGYDSSVSLSTNLSQVFPTGQSIVHQSSTTSSGSALSLGDPIADWNGNAIMKRLESSVLSLLGLKSADSKNMTENNKCPSGISETTTLASMSPQPILRDHYTPPEVNRTLSLPRSKKSEAARLHDDPIYGHQANFYI